MTQVQEFPLLNAGAGYHPPSTGLERSGRFLSLCSDGSLCRGAEMARPSGPFEMTAIGTDPRPGIPSRTGRSQAASSSAHKEGGRFGR